MLDNFIIFGNVFVTYLSKKKGFEIMALDKMPVPKAVCSGGARV